MTLMQFGRLLALVVAVMSLSISVFGQRKLPVLQATGPQLSIRVDSVFNRDRWNVDPKLKPDVFKATVTKKPVRVAFMSANDSVVHIVKAGDLFDFIVLTTNGDSALTRIEGVQFTEPVTFSRQYIAEHTGKTFVEIPDVYELVNVLFALTKQGQETEGIVNKDTPYYQEVLTYFEKYQSEGIVTQIDSLLRSDMWQYFNLKMDAYSFEMDVNGKIRQSPVYDRVAWGMQNHLRPFAQQLEAFAQKSDFPAFYRKHKAYYDQLIRSYRDSLGVADMQRWLNKNFPSTTYQSFKIIFSPLVSSSQSAQWFANDGFKEAQAHVNYPFLSAKDQSVPAVLLNARRGNIVFTELNHAFINPETDKYDAELKNAITNLDYWLADGKPAKQGYNNLYSCFNEYMNWGLVSLRYADLLPASMLMEPVTQLEKMMVDRRGFIRFAEFNQFLLKSYQNRPANKTVADLYPQTIRWFASQKQ